MPFNMHKIYFFQTRYSKQAYFFIWPNTQSSLVNSLSAKTKQELGQMMGEPITDILTCVNSLHTG